MIFSSIPFLYYFLPVVLLVYYLSPKVLKNPVLLISSLIFYGWGEPRYVFLMLFTVMLGYIFGILIEKFRDKKISKLFLILSVLSSLFGLVYFKYADFFIANFNKLKGFSIPFLRLALPIGISFYTFQILSYTIDVYRNNVKAQKNPLTLATYVALFPQLIAGPIVRYSDVENQLKNREHTFEKCADGIKRFIIGLSKKVLIANAIGELGEAFLSTQNLSVMYYWLYVISFMLQIYYDFSGYSDMAIGLGKFFGFDFMENFNYPFVSKSITEFWRRWHISLGTWFRDYVYIPLGGNRVKKTRMLFNIFVVWFLTGFWHGAEWNFIVWGLYFGVLLTLEKFYFLKHLEKHKILSHIYTMFFITVSFMIFAAPNMEGVVKYLTSMFGFSGIPFISDEFIYNLKNYAFILIIAIVGSVGFSKYIKNLIDEKAKDSIVVYILELVFLMTLIFAVTGYLVDGSFNPFLYFRF